MVDLRSEDEIAPKASLELTGTAPRGGLGVWLFSQTVGELCINSAVRVVRSPVHAVGFSNIAFLAGSQVNTLPHYRMRS